MGSDIGPGGNRARAPMRNNGSSRSSSPVRTESFGNPVISALMLSRPPELSLIPATAAG
jgi:hypothetical protein